MSRFTLIHFFYNPRDKPNRYQADKYLVTQHNKNSSGDEIANVNFYAVRPGSYPNLLK